MARHIRAKLAYFQSPYLVWVRDAHHLPAKPGLGLGWLLSFCGSGHARSLQNREGQQKRKKSGICPNLSIHIEEGVAEELRSLSYEKTDLCNLSPAVFVNAYPKVTHCHCEEERPTNLLYHSNPQFQQDYFGSIPHARPSARLASETQEMISKESWSSWELLEGCLLNILHHNVKNDLKSNHS